MVRPAMGNLLRLFDEGSLLGESDGELLGRFLDRRGDAGSAFGALVARHGPMVARVCRAILEREPDAEDAFQATFLVLVRRAGAIGERDLLGPWLYRVALRIARRARRDAARRAGREGGQAAEGFDLPDRASTARPGPWSDDAPTLLEEVDRLPTRYRLPVVLCHLQGLTHAEAARDLAWPVGTVSVRLARARRLLADRLARRGVGTPASGVTLPPIVALPVAPGWLTHTTAAGLAAAHRLPLIPPVAGVAHAASRGAFDLARRTAPMSLIASWQWLVLPFATLLAAGVGVTLSVGGIGSGPPASATQPQSPPPNAQVPAAPSRIRVQLVDPARRANHPPTDGPPILFRGKVRGNQRDQRGQQLMIEADHMALHFQTTSPDEPQPKPKSQINQLVEVEADSLDAHGTLANLDQIVPQLSRTDPSAQVHLQVTGTPNQPVTYREVDPARSNRPAANIRSRSQAIDINCSADQLWTIVQRLETTSRQATFELQIDGGTVRYQQEAAPVAIHALPTMPPPLPSPSVPPGSALEGPVPPRPFDTSPRGTAIRPQPIQSDTAASPLIRPADEPVDPTNHPESVQVGQTIVVEVLEALPGRPLGGPRVVRHDGTISLGFYGDLPVAGLNRDQIKLRLVEHLRRHLTDEALGLVVLDPDGKPTAVPPLQSGRVFVDDQPTPISQVDRTQPAPAPR